MDDKRFALLIDSDNISAKYIDGIMDELSQYGVVTYRRIYGDFTRTSNAKWSEKLLEKSIIPIQQFSNTSGKNATDSALIIDAMDLLYQDNTDGFCIVSSDSDFTRLASRLRESGKTVIGMGEKKTPDSFRAACTVFTELENLLDDEYGKGGSSAASKDLIEEAIIHIVTQNENHGKTTTGTGEIGSKLRNKYPDFDIRNYGYTQLSRFLEDMPGIELIKNNYSIEVSLRDTPYADPVVKDVISFVRASKDPVSLSALGQEIRKRHRNFSVRRYGYSQFYKFVDSIPGLKVSGGKNDRTVVCTGEK